jgi:hypothetical protein
VVSLLAAYDRNVGDEFYLVLFPLALFALGTLATSDVFVDMHRRGTNTAFLSLPASALEKTLSRLLLTTVGVIVYVALFTTVLSLVLEGINAVAFGVRREFYTPLDGAWPILPHYLVVQSIFFLGAAWFRKLHYIKTVGATLALCFGLVAIAVVLAWVVGSQLMWGGDGYRVSNFDGPVQGIEVVARAVYYFALPVFCWFVAWLRVTEAQVSHGI